MHKLKRYHSNPILEKNPASPWEAGSVFNPCVIRDGEVFRMFYRATNDTRHKEKGGYISSIGYAESQDGVAWTRDNQPILAPSEPYDEAGCEDARVTKIGDTYYLHYTAISLDSHDKKVVRVALATSNDAKHWTKHGIVGPAGSRSKAATLFPEAINGKYWWFYTWEADRPESTVMSVAADSLEQIVEPPAGQIAETLENYDKWAVFAPPAKAAILRGPEIGAPPIKTDKGWLVIYCGANLEKYPNWTINAALLDLNDPRRIIAETPWPILEPETDEEVNGEVKNVTFPEGAVVVGDELYVYYGSGDQGCCLATCNLDELMASLVSTEQNG